ncbi:partial [Paramuricea clavata]|uniref:Partial n=1 Tax=Paramuricea clavata TaxID=317549 RepID=A0A6S7HAH0_PARCT|nr:partial [Paramuricea clavata]
MEVLRLSNIIRQHDEEINNFQQYSRRDCVEIAGLPVEPDEDTNALTIKVGSLMGVHIDEKDISISHRLPHKAQNETYSSRLRPREGGSTGVNSANRFPRIIVKFVRRSVKEQFYQGRKYLKDKSTKDIGLSRLSVNNIFISESLSPRNKSLFKDCLKFKRDHSFRYIWTQSGRIYLRKNKDLPAHVISSTQDLEALSR